MPPRAAGKPLAGKVAVVAGATRGAGRGIATMLGAAGATVYCTGRTTRAAARRRTPAKGAPFDLSRRRETIEDTADLVTAAGGRGIAVRVDHAREGEVEALFARLRREAGRLDVLVNDIWGGDALVEWGRAFWEVPVARGIALLENAIHTHLVTARHALPLMISRRRGLVVEITDGDRLSYRGELFYDLVKTTVIRIAFDLAEELRPHRVAAVAVTPGFLRSEAMLDHLGVTEATWRDGARKDPHFVASETPAYVGRAVAALAADPRVLERSGRVLSSWGLAKEYAFTDLDGTQPDFPRHLGAARDAPSVRLREA
jgi:NAD(P)-dependent dehydrogenase (short-subunit alcohol dehydrogenase family)